MQSEKKQLEDQLVSQSKEREAAEAKVANLEMKLAQFDPRWNQHFSTLDSQDFELKKFLDITGALQAQITVLKKDFIAKMLKKKIKAVDELRHLLTYKMQQVNVLVEEIRCEIQANLCTKENFEGCLEGNMDEYVKSFEPQIETLSNKLSENRERLERKMEGKDE